MAHKTITRPIEYEKKLMTTRSSKLLPNKSSKRLIKDNHRVKCPKDKL